MAQPALQPLNKFAAITPGDTSANDFALGLSDAIYVGGAGAIVGVMPDGSTITFAGALAGSILPFKLKRINSTGTVATNLVACYQV